MSECTETPNLIPAEALDGATGMSQPLGFRLRTLARHGRQVEKRCQAWGLSKWTDDLTHLSPSNRASWQRVLSSVATTEHQEGSVLIPLQQAKAGELEPTEYLQVHAADEHRHYAILSGYLRNTFQFDVRKKKRTFSDEVLYDRVLPRLMGLVRRKPLFGFALLYCYERFSLVLYGQLRIRAQTDGAQNLLTLIQMIEKDELRHVAGMEQLLRSEIQGQSGLKFLDRGAVRALLNILLVDVDLRPWALHNRALRGHLMDLGVDPDALTLEAGRMVQATLDLMQEAAEGGPSHGH